MSASSTSLVNAGGEWIFSFRIWISLEINETYLKNFGTSVIFFDLKVQINVLLHLEIFVYNSGCTIQPLSSTHKCHQYFLSHNSTDDLRLLNFDNFEVPGKCYSDIRGMEGSICQITKTETLQALRPQLRQLWTYQNREIVNKVLQIVLTLIIKGNFKKYQF